MNNCPGWLQMTMSPSRQTVCKTSDVRVDWSLQHSTLDVDGQADGTRQHICCILTSVPARHRCGTTTSRPHHVMLQPAGHIHRVMLQPAGHTHPVMLQPAGHTHHVMLQPAGHTHRVMFVCLSVFIWRTFCSTSHSRRSGTDHIVLPANYTVPASTS